jgi:hypothetical protein
MRNTLPIWVLFAGLGTGGCHSLERDRVSVEYHPDQPPAITVAPYDATFSLKISEPHSTCVISTIELKKGERVGYQVGQDGALVAIAGDKVIPIPDRWSEWRYSPIPGNSFEWLLVTGRSVSEDVLRQTATIILLPIALPAWWYTMKHPPPNPHDDCGNNSSGSDGKAP